MRAKIAAFLITLLVNIVAGIAIFFFLLIAMNGFSESDATYGLVTYILSAAIASVAMASSAALSAHVLLNREFSGMIAVTIPVAIFSLVGIVLKIACSVVALLVAEHVRVNY